MPVVLLGRQRGSGANDPNPHAFKRSQRFGTRAGVGNQRVDGASRADECRTNLAKFARVGGDDHRPGLLDHLAVDQRFICLERGGTAFGVETRDAHEDLVHINVVEKVECGITGKRERPRPGNHAACQVGADARLVAQLHADIDGIGHDLNLVAVAQAAADVRRGGARSQSHRFSRFDNLSGRNADAAFFRRAALFACQERTVVAKRFIEQRLHQFRAAMGTANQAAILQSHQIAANAWRGRSCDGKQFIDGGGSRAEQEVDDLLGAAANGFCHLTEILSR